jgi:hypothetical protein
LIINLLFVKLFTIQLLLLVDKRQWWDDHLWILFDHVVPELHEINVQPLDLPPEWISLEHNHEGLGPDNFANLGRNQLINAILNKNKMDVLTQQRKFKSRLFH